jgi:hypothetical protein
LVTSRYSEKKYAIDIAKEKGYLSPARINLGEASKADVKIIAQTEKAEKANVNS